jgi:hypothetical protein
MMLMMMMLMMMMIDDDQWSMVIADHWYQPCINKPLGF